VSADATSAGDWLLPPRERVGVACLITAESAMFVIFVVAYLFYLGKSASGQSKQNDREAAGRFNQRHQDW